MTSTDVVAPYVVLEGDGAPPGDCTDCLRPLGAVLVEMYHGCRSAYVPWAMLWAPGSEPRVSVQRRFCLSCAANHAQLEAFMTRRRS